MIKQKFFLIEGWVNKMQRHDARKHMDTWKQSIHQTEWQGQIWLED